MSTKPAKPKILKVVRTDAFVKIRQEAHRDTEQQVANDPDNPGKAKTKLVTSTSEYEETSHEAPLPAFDTALQALAAVAAKTLEAPPDWKDGITVVSVAISYTEHGIRSAAIGFSKAINATNSQHPLKTPAFQIDDGKTPDQGRRQCTPTHADLVVSFIKQAQRYAAGERSQQLLKFEDCDGDGDDRDCEGQEPLEFTTLEQSAENENAHKPIPMEKPKRARKKKAPVAQTSDAT